MRRVESTVRMTPGRGRSLVRRRPRCRSLLRRHPQIPLRLQARPRPRPRSPGLRRPEEGSLLSMWWRDAVCAGGYPPSWLSSSSCSSSSASRSACSSATAPAHDQDPSPPLATVQPCAGVGGVAGGLRVDDCCRPGRRNALAVVGRRRDAVDAATGSGCSRDRSFADAVCIDDGSDLIQLGADVHDIDDGSGPSLLGC